MHRLIGGCRKFDLPVDIQMEVFRSTTLPVTLYGCRVWGICCACKEIHCVWGPEANPLVIGMKILMTNYWLSFITGKREKLSDVTYQCLLHLDTAGLHITMGASGQRNVNMCGLSGIRLNQEALTLCGRENSGAKA